MLKGRIFLLDTKSLSNVIQFCLQGKFKLVFILILLLYNVIYTIFKFLCDDVSRRHWVVRV